LLWVRDNTPEPFGDKSFYYADYGDAVIGTRYAFPDSAYAVTAWTDYGYWITRIAHRIPNDNPAHLPQPDRGVYALLFAQDDTVVIDTETKLRTRYVILDYATVLPKFMPILNYFGDDTGKYAEWYRVSETVSGNTTSKPIMLYYPEYYQTFMVRLFMFDGRTVKPSRTTVVQFRVEQSSDLKTVTKAWNFELYDDAVKFVRQHPDTVIVGTSPLVSPVPLDRLEGHELVHEYRGRNIGEAVKVFEVIR
jgi:asparagine N-glycosylation enzyme membrane subunit Stt3